ncbi:MAG: metallophosphoesterase family protein [Burkholderiales bacterium]
MARRSKHPVRHLGDVHGVARGAASSAWRTHRQTESVQEHWADPTRAAKPGAPAVRFEAAARVTEPGATLRSRFKLLTINVLAWGWNYARYVLRPRFRPFPTYQATPERSPGIIKMKRGPVTLALAGDWGSGTYSAYRVADRITTEFQADYTIHLGDVYYSGTGREFEDYFMPEDAWPEGTMGTFALNGNHEMYSGGKAYFHALRQKTRPLFNEKGEQVGEKPGKLTYAVEGQPERLPQDVSYFCLENDHWRVVALDTGYYAKTFPFLELFDTQLIKLHSAIRQWLKQVVFADPTDRRPVILLSHHEWFSAYDSEYTRMGKQVAPYLDRVLLWFWGHEHRFSAYAPFGLDANGAQVRARCIGHGGIPFDIAYPKRHRRLVCSDERISSESTNYVDAEQQLGFCGFALLRFDGPTLSVAYYDERQGSAPLLEETWSREARTGTATGAVTGGAALAKYRDGYPKVPPKRVDDLDRINALGGTWRFPEHPPRK